MKSLLVAIVFLCACTAGSQALRFPKDFVFGVANAPGQVEDHLDDVWLDWGKAGRIHGWSAAPRADERLQFWTHPEIELDLAKQLGVNAFRLGVDWGRIQPTRTSFDVAAIEHYRIILKLIHLRKMKVMLTLAHHSVPRWVQDSDGFHNDDNRAAFVEFAKRMMTEYHDDVDWWITFNEANVFALNAYTTGLWPPGETRSPLSLLPIFGGSGVKAIDTMASAHNEVYEWAHAKWPSVQIGIAHNMAHYRGRKLIDQLKARFADGSMNWHLPEKIAGHMDFFGMNYYGAEWLDGNSVGIYPDEEYSEAGRAIDANGLLTLLRNVHEKFPSLPVLITENGIADADDNLRSAYLMEHLAAIHTAIEEGILVRGFFEWTLTDNLEWSDGYCPRFGLVDVDRATMLRKPRGSYFLFQKIIASHEVSQTLRDAAWSHVVSLRGKLHGMCRDEDGSTALDQPAPRAYSSKDWRFR